MNLEKYIKAMKDAYASAYAKYEAARMDYDSAIEKLNQSAGQSDMTEERYAVQLEDAETKFTDIIAEIMESVPSVIDEQSAAYKAEVSAFYAPDGSAIDLNDMNLIKSGLILSPADIWSRFEKYADNTTMLQIFRQYVQQNNIRLEGETGEKIREVIHRVSDQGKAEEHALKAFIQLAGAGLSHMGTNDEVYLFVWRKLDDYELQAQIEILKAQPVIDDAVREQIQTKEDQIKELEAARLNAGKENE